MPDPPSKPDPPNHRAAPPQRVRSDIPFFSVMIALGGVYLLLIVSMIAADIRFASLSGFASFGEVLADERIRFSIWLSLITCTLSAIFSVWVAVPIGYLMSRYRFFGKNLLDTVFDIPIVLPPLVVGLSLLVLFGSGPGHWLDEKFADLMAFLGFKTIRGIRFEVPAIILGQFMVAAAFAVRTMRVTFDQIDPRPEEVALTLGASRGRAFAEVTLPQSYRGMLAAFTLAWARSLGEFGPILIFAGTTRMKTEVLSSSVYLEWSSGNIDRAVAVSLVMVALAMVVLVVARLLGVRASGGLSDTSKIGGRA